MVDPYDFVASPQAKKSKQTRRKSIMKYSKRKKSNEKPRRVSIQQTMRTRSSTRDTSKHLNDVKEKENNNGFTQLIQTKMMEVKKRQGKRVNRKESTITDDNHSPLVLRKRQRSVDHEEQSTTIPNSAEIDPQDNNLPLTTNDEHVNADTTACHPRCESKEHYLAPTTKRRRACLCSKRQLDELEFAPDSISSQTQQQKEEQQQQPPQEDPHLEPISTSIHHSPPPPPLLLLPSSPLIPPSTFTYPLPPIQSAIQPEEQNEEEEEEEERQLPVPSILAAPLSPAMPLNSTFIAHRSMPLMTQLPSTLLAISTLLAANTTMVRDSTPSNSTSVIEQKTSDHSPLLAPIESTSNRQDQETSVIQTAAQTLRCSVSTQTNNDDYSTHHHCNDVSVCPCVQIYTRSEQLFMASMAIFFRNSISITPPEPSLTTISNPMKKSNKRQQINHHVISSQPTPVINEMEAPLQIETNIQNNKTIEINEIVPLTELAAQQTSPILVDTSTIIHETHHANNTKKSDGSSIQINVNTREERNENSHEEISSSDRQKFHSFVLTATALKDEQKNEFNRFIEYFSIRSSTSIDDSTTHLITDEEDQNSLICPLTGKVLQAVARHLTIVSYRWLTACLTEQRFIDESPTYEIIGDTIYNQHNGMSRSRLNHSRLLANYAFHFKCHGCQPFTDNRPLIELIHLSGGLILKTLNQHIDNIGRQIIILCSKTYLLNKPALQQACQKLKIYCLEPEWLIASIVKFDIQAYEPWLCTLYS